MRFVILFFALLLAIPGYAQFTPQIVEAQQFSDHFYFKILLNPNAPDGSVEGEADERRWRIFKWGLDKEEPGPAQLRFSKIKQEMKLIVLAEEKKRGLTQAFPIPLPSEVGPL